ncbi:LrgB family protein [Bacillus sp. Marseille-Q1617]|uniref:LrgB family protein n=1 Tax=Bacillus sp. Marseille-Q1617 TaxID=2736887 RepID=UPI00158E7158|nr:LrgB family protein [Bacillus sp. Marseille-Q1617]
MIDLINGMAAIGITVLYFILSIKIHRLWSSPLTIPIFLSSAALILTLFILDIPYDKYAEGTAVITYLLGPATVALAYPLYQFRKLLAKHWQPIISGIITGSGVSMVISYCLMVILDIPAEFNRSFLVKTITTPVAVEIGKLIDGKIEVIPAVVILTGIFGAMFLPYLLKALNISHPIAKGLPFGVISHGIGTAQALKEGEEEGAISGAAMALTAVILSFFIPLIFLIV